MDIDQPTATLIAASVASLSAIANLVLGQRAGRSAEGRAQYRQLLAPYIVELGQTLHEILATATVAVRRKDLNKGPENWLARTVEACDRLREDRLAVKYPLLGVEEGLRALTRLGHWLQAKIDSDEQRHRLIKQAESLRRALDSAIRDAYLAGRPPGILTRVRVGWLVRRIYRQWNSRAGSEDDEDILAFGKAPTGREMNAD